MSHLAHSAHVSPRRARQSKTLVLHTVVWLKWGFSKIWFKICLRKKESNTFRRFACHISFLKRSSYPGDFFSDISINIPYTCERERPVRARRGARNISCSWSASMRTRLSVRCRNTERMVLKLLWRLSQWQEGGFPGTWKICLTFWTYVVYRYTASNLRSRTILLAEGVVY